MNKVLIFLDIDGVFSTKDALQAAWKDYTGCDTFDESRDYLKKYNIPWPNLSMYDWPFDKECCSNFHLLQRKLYEMGLEPNVVISSSWRIGFVMPKDVTEETFRKDTIKDVFVKKGLQVTKIIDKTPYGGDRGEEILRWLKDNGEAETPYVSIDDENPYDVEKHIGKEKCVNTKFKTGFQKEHVEETINKLISQMKNTEFDNWLKEQGFYIVHEHWMYNNKLVKEETIQSKFREFNDLKKSKE